MLNNTETLEKETVNETAESYVLYKDAPKLCNVCTKYRAIRDKNLQNMEIDEYMYLIYSVGYSTMDVKLLSENLTFRLYGNFTKSCFVSDFCIGTIIPEETFRFIQNISETVCIERI